MDARRNVIFVDTDTTDVRLRIITKRRFNIVVTQKRRITQKCKKRLLIQ